MGEAEDLEKAWLLGRGMGRGWTTNTGGGVDGDGYKGE